jgi:hypothetical protein
VYEVCACTRLQTAASIEHVRFTYTEVSPIGFFCIAKIPKPTDCATDFCKQQYDWSSSTNQMARIQNLDQTQISSFFRSNIFDKPKNKTKTHFQTLKQLKRHTKRNIQTHISLSLSLYLNSVNRRSFYISNLSYSLLIQSLGFLIYIITYLRSFLYPQKGKHPDQLILKTINTYLL